MKPCIITQFSDNHALTVLECPAALRTAAPSTTWGFSDRECCLQARSTCVSGGRSKGLTAVSSDNRSIKGPHPSCMTEAEQFRVK